MVCLRGVLLFLLLCASDILGEGPVFHVPPGIDPEGDQVLLLEQGFEDAIVLARVAAITFDPCDVYFNRYFNAEDSKFVSDVFRTIANIPLDLSMEDLSGNLNPDLSTIVTGSLNSKFPKLEIAIGDHPDRDDLSERCEDDHIDGFYSFNPNDPTAGLLSICIGAWRYPSLDDILEPPPSWKGTPGFECDGLGPRESNLELPLGGVILHEMLHWPYLFQNDVPDWSTKVPTLPQYPTIRQIPDYKDPTGNPPDGYGPYYAPQLKNVPKGKWGPQYPITTNNADSFVYFATTKYWSLKCNRDFAPPVDEDDAEQRDDLWNEFLPDASPSPPHKRSTLRDRLLGYRYNGTSHPHSRIKR